MITFKQSGNFEKTDTFLRNAKRASYLRVLSKYAEEGVAALAQATPKESGETATSWSYEIKEGRGSVSVVWKNNHVVNGANVAILLQYGHGTRNGGYVQGRDYINPAMRSVFDKMADAAWKEVTRV